LQVSIVLVKIISKFQEAVFMRKIFLILMSVLLILLTGCGEEEKVTAPGKVEGVAEPSKEFLVAYFSCTGTTKKLAEYAAEVLDADLYEIKPEQPYTEEDLDHTDETHRATIEQRDEKFRTPLADTNANVADYKNIVIAFPLWWGIAPRIIDTFVETYDFSGKTVIPICTSGSSELGTGAEYLQSLTSDSANWKPGKSFFKNFSKDDVKTFFDGLGL